MAKQHKVLVQEWDESEAGWGVRPDGASFHLSPQQMEQYNKEYWDGMPKEVPHEYSRPAGSKEIMVDTALFNKIVKSENGYRMWQHEYREFETKTTVVLKKKK